MTTCYSTQRECLGHAPLRYVKNIPCRVGKLNVLCWPTQRAALADATCCVLTHPVGLRAEPHIHDGGTQQQIAI